MAKLNIALCSGRHEIPQAIDGAVYTSEFIQRFATNNMMLEERAFSVLWGIAHRLGETSHTINEDDPWDYSEAINRDRISVNLYVTGMTIALIAFLNVCHREKIHVTLYHYNKESGDYFPQNLAW